MIYKAEELIEKLYQHANDYAEGKTQNFEEICMDCKRAAEMISVLKSSKHTQKRKRQRISKKNRENNEKIESLTAELECLRSKLND